MNDARILQILGTQHKAIIIIGAVFTITVAAASCFVRFRFLTQAFRLKQIATVGLPVYLIHL